MHLPLDIWVRIFSFMNTSDCIQTFNTLWENGVLDSGEMNYLDTFFVVVSECRQIQEQIPETPTSWQVLKDMGFDDESIKLHTNRKYNYYH